MLTDFSRISCQRQIPNTNYSGIGGISVIRNVSGAMHGNHSFNCFPVRRCKCCTSALLRFDIKLSKFVSVKCNNETINEISVIEGVDVFTHRSSTSPPIWGCHIIAVGIADISSETVGFKGSKQMIPSSALLLARLYSTQFLIYISESNKADQK
jgi:hypothetical protein